MSTKTNSSPTGKCAVCGRSLPLARLTRATDLRESVNAAVKETVEGWNPEASICSHCLTTSGARYVQTLLLRERGELTELERQVVESMREQEILAENLNTEFQEGLTIGQRLADRVAGFGGSWKFIGTFCLFLAGWIAFNVMTTDRLTFDPFPFILLNLILSCIAALQAPVIMMSQNRQEAKDRLRSEYDYKINLKAELEIRHLHLKLDELMSHQWQRLLEIQDIQTELLSQLADRESRR